MRLPIPQSIIDELRAMKASSPVVVAQNGEVLNAEDALGLIALAQRPGPEVSPGALVRAGLNGFAVELLVESIRQFADFETFGPIRFSMRGVSITVAFDPESDERHKERRVANGVPEQDPHWSGRPNGELAAIPVADGERSAP